MNLYFSLAQRRPFQVVFHTDGNEVESTAAANDGYNDNELEGAPGGIIGFYLNFVQQNC